jgi:Flp pilus assembly protein TadD
MTDGQDSRSHTDRGIELHNNDDLDGAIAEYRTALRLNPNNVSAHNRLGNALQDKGELDGAIAEYRTALHLDPSHAPAHNNLGLEVAPVGWTVSASS